MKKLIRILNSDVVLILTYVLLAVLSTILLIQSIPAMSFNLGLAIWGLCVSFFVIGDTFGPYLDKINSLKESI